MSRPLYEYRVVKNVPIPMRDGTSLSADLYLPVTGRKVPVVLLRSPYGKAGKAQEGGFWARRGYAFVAQDCRGRFKSGGDWEPYIYEGRDGYDTIEWSAAQPWCNGRVAMVGGSYEGLVQWQAAVLKPPHLVTIVPSCCSPYPVFIHNKGGTRRLSGQLQWAYDLYTEEGKIDKERFPKPEYEYIYETLPITEIDYRIVGFIIPFWRKWADPSYVQTAVRNADYLPSIGRVDIPVLHQSSWFDGARSATRWNYEALQVLGRPRQKLIMGPWGHTNWSHTFLGSLDFGQVTLVNLQREYLRWCDHWLKGLANGVDREKPVRLFILGENRWLEADRYPPAESELLKLFLHRLRNGADGAPGSIEERRPQDPMVRLSL
jgi:putative CocE/NonD family hydrolase